MTLQFGYISTVLTQFELKFTNIYNTYTKQVSVNELRQGNVTMTMFAGKYDVSYNPVHNPLYSDKIDVSINMTGVNVNGSPINLTGNIEDGLFIVDIPLNFLYPFPNGIMDNRGSSFPTLFYDPENDFYYGYTNTRPINPLTIYFFDHSCGSVDVLTFQKKYVYWLSKTQNGTVNLTFPSLTVERITL